MLPSSSAEVTPSLDNNPNEMAIRPGYTVRPYDNDKYLVPVVLCEKDMPLAAVEMPDVSGIWDQDPGVSHSNVWTYCILSHPAEFIPDDTSQSRIIFSHL